MTERLTTLLRDEAQALEIPAAPAVAVLATGRRQRRRRQLGTGLAAAAALAVVAAGSVMVYDGIGGGSETEFSATGSGVLAFSVGRDVHLGGAEAPVVTLDEDIHSLHYTSAGVVARTNRNGGVSDGSGPEHFTLIRPDGSTRKLHVTTEDAVVSTDVDQPLLAYSQVTDGVAQVVVHDVSSDEEVGRVDLPARYEPAAWESPPVWLDGDLVYVGFRDVTLAVEWVMGEITEVDHLDGGMPLVLGGRTTDYVRLGQADDARGLAEVVDVETGQALLSIEVADYGYFVLSPDGQYAMLQLDSMDGEDAFDVYHVRSARKATVDRSFYGFGWTVDGDLFRLEEGQLVICDADTGQCSSEPSGVDADDVLGPEEPMPGEVTRCDEDGRCVEVETNAPQPLPVKVGGLLYES